MTGKGSRAAIVARYEVAIRALQRRADALEEERQGWRRRALVAEQALGDLATLAIDGLRRASEDT